MATTADFIYNEAKNDLEILAQHSPLCHMTWILNTSDSIYCMHPDPVRDERKHFRTHLLPFNRSFLSMF